MNQGYYAEYPEIAETTFAEDSPAAPLFLRMLLFVAVVLLGTVSANNIFPSEVGLVLSQLSIVVLAGAVFLLGFIGCGWKIKMPPEAALSLGLVLWCLTGYVVAIYQPYFVVSYITFVKTMGLYVVIVNLVRSRKDFIWMAAGYVLTVMLLFLMGSEVISEAGVSGERAAGIVGDANALATWATMGIVSSVICFNCFRSFLLKAIVLLPMPIFLFMIVRSGSRTGMLGIMLVIILIYWWYIRGQVKEQSGWIKLVAFLVGIVFIAGVFYLVMSGEFWFRIQKTFAFGAYTSRGIAQDEQRLELYSAGIKIIKESPVFGAGYQQMRITAEKVAHNTWIEAGADGGIPALAMWLGAYIILTRRIWKIRKNPALPLVDRGVVSMCLVFIAFWWFRSLFFNHLGEKVLLPVIAGITGYVTSLNEQYDHTFTERAYDDYDKEPIKDGHAIEK